VILAIESSCDETAVAIFDLKKFNAGIPLAECASAEEISSSAKLHEAYGGIVPELAAREQTLALPPLVRRALNKAAIKLTELTAIAVTSGPGLNGSLLVGLSFAKGLSYSLKIPLIPVNHLDGHLSAQLFLETSERLEKPFLSLMVSGGHTEVILDAEKRTVLARTRDDAAGEAFDKCASLLGLAYPGGAELSALAERGNRSRFSFPVALPDDLKSFSFSGLKTAVLKVVKELGELSSQDKCDVAAGVESAISKALVLKTIQLATKHRATGIFLTGGVAANKFIRAELQSLCDVAKLKCRFADMRYCTDNASMIAAAALNKISSIPEFSSWAPTTGFELGPEAGFTINTRTSWPLTE